MQGSLGSRHTSLATSCLLNGTGSASLKEDLLIFLFPAHTQRLKLHILFKLIYGLMRGRSM